MEAVTDVRAFDGKIIAVVGETGVAMHLVHGQTVLEAALALQLPMLALRFGIITVNPAMILVLLLVGITMLKTTDKRFLPLNASGFKNNSTTPPISQITRHEISVPILFKALGIFELVTFAVLFSTISHRLLFRGLVLKAVVSAQIMIDSKRWTRTALKKWCAARLHCKVGHVRREANGIMQTAHSGFQDTAVIPLRPQVFRIGQRDVDIRNLEERAGVVEQTQGTMQQGLEEFQRSLHVESQLAPLAWLASPIATAHLILVCSTLAMLF
ncbi:unnamed protein product [Prorocentrum cordatum]|uniref:Uncharacterized protein n=1 Tax=Prorocentrum cordatum TaxID=2364126 RepID=A0ABN9TQR3_9DINO|nr:unnamed protein product [Polarella glacialis]